MLGAAGELREGHEKLAEQRVTHKHHRACIALARRGPLKPLAKGSDGTKVATVGGLPHPLEVIEVLGEEVAAAVCIARVVVSLAHEARDGGGVAPSAGERTDVDRPVAIHWHDRSDRMARGDPLAVCVRGPGVGPPAMHRGVSSLGSVVVGSVLEHVAALDVLPDGAGLMKGIRRGRYLE